MPPHAFFDHTVIMTSNRTQQTTRVVAKSFYTLLKKHGFTSDQIIGVSTAILDCLLQSLTVYKQNSGEQANFPICREGLPDKPRREDTT